MIIITFTALSILDDGLHEPEDFYRLHSTCTGNVTFKVLLSRLSALAHEAQPPVPQTRVAWTWNSTGRLCQCQKTLCIVLCGSLSSCFLQSHCEWSLFPASCPQVPSDPANPDVCTQDPNIFLPWSLSQAFFPGFDCLIKPLKKLPTACGFLQAEAQIPCFSFSPAVFPHIWLQTSSMMSIFPHPWQSSLEPLTVLCGGHAAFRTSCFFREGQAAVHKVS